MIFAAEWAVATIPDDVPNKSAKEWKDAIKVMRKTLLKLQELNPLHFSYLDSELRKNDDTCQLLKYYSDFYVLPYDKTMTFGMLHHHIIKSIMLWDDLLGYSLKSIPASRPQERNALIQYCYMLHRVFEEYTGKSLTINSPFERFAWECLQPLQGIIKHSYTQESLRKSIRAAKNFIGAKSKEK